MKNRKTMDDTASDLVSRLALEGGAKVRSTPFGPRWVFDETDQAQLESVLARAPRAWRSGEKVREFVTAFQSLFGVRNAVATGSGTAAIHAAAGALDLQPGDEVITTPATDIGTVLGLLQHNLVPVFADWGEGVFNTCPTDMECRITDRTKALLVVHLFGFPCDMDAIMALAAKYNLAVIEDCAQAHLSEHKGRKVGVFGDLACWSFGLKTLTTEQGGMVSARTPELAAMARGFLSKGSVKEDGAWIPYSRLGTFAPLTDLQAGIGMAQIARLEDATCRRESVAAMMDGVFGQIDAVTLPTRGEGDRNVYYMYPYHFDEAAAGVSVAKFIEALRAEGISDAFGPYLKGRPLHRQRLFLNLDTYGGSGFPLRDKMGVVRVDYASLRLPRVERLLPGLGFFHMRNSFTEQDGRDIAEAIIKVSRGLGFGPGRATPVGRASPALAVDEDVSVRHRAPDTYPISNAPPQPMHAPDPAAPQVRKPDASAEPSDEFVELSPARDAGPENARRLQAAIDRLADRGGRLRLPPGRFKFSESIRLVRRRNLILKGAGGNLLDGGTRLEFDTPEARPGLHLRTAAHCQFQSMALIALSAGPAVSVGCDEEGADGTSSLSLDFSQCTVSAQDGYPAVALRDCAAVRFAQCWLKGPGDAAWLGAPQRRGARSISNGLVNSVRFDTCLIFAPTQLVRASCISWTGCHFSAPAKVASALINASGEDCSQAISLSLRDNFALEGGAETFLRAGPACESLVMEANRLRGFADPVAIAGAQSAVIRANTFENTSIAESDLNPEGKPSILCEANSLKPS